MVIFRSYVELPKGILREDVFLVSMIMIIMIVSISDCPYHQLYHYLDGRITDILIIMFGTVILDVVIMMTRLL